jgi:putative nucleotidyltransferase with HDIG domain
MAKILIVEDDEFLRDILVDYLTQKGHSVTPVPNGKVAKGVVIAGGFELVVSDVQMPFMNGVEFLQWLRPQSKIPFILMTGFTNLIETHQAAELGAEGFLSKPFSNQDLLRLINEILKPPAPPEIVPPAESTTYCKVSIDEFVARPKIDYDIYVRLKQERFVKVAHAGDLLDIARLKSYSAKGIAHLYIRKEDFNKLINFNVQLGKILKDQDKISPEKKARFMRYTGEVIMEKCFVDDIDKEAFGEAKEFLTTSVEAITQDPDLYNLANVLNEHSDHLYAHCLGVAIYSIMIAKKMGITFSLAHFKLSMAGLFHDIGKKEIDRELLEKSRARLSVAERKLIESHADRSREIMESVPGVPAEVIQIIYEHHEDEIEQGYPCKTHRLKLHPLSRIVHVADLFVTRAIKSPTNPNASATGAISHIEKFEAERVNLTAFTALKEIILKKAA